MATPTWWKPLTQGRPKVTSLQDYFQQALTNKAIQYMVDPSTQASTAMFLSRDNPALFGGYGGMGAAPQPTDQNVFQQRQTLRQLSPSWFANVIHQLDPGVVRSGLPASVKTDLGKTENLAASQDVDAASRWLNDYLKTASLAAGVGKQAPTRATQGFVRERLGTLTREAQDAPTKSGRYVAFAENLVNPVLRRVPTTGILGINRAVQSPTGEARRGAAGFRNPFAL